MEQHKPFLEILNTEKQMLASIYSKGILHNDILELYQKIRSEYEKILLSTNQMIELQEVEHHMWRLHYELIDEFRRRIKQRSYNTETTKNNTDQGLERFKSFLSEGTEFYRNLIVKLRGSYGLPTEIFLNNKDRWSFSVEPIKLHACQHTCHRLFICVGDLARYNELMKKPDACDWSTAAMYYLEASRTWPDSGNPHNQLALLATYVGDAFLALYHCIRSLAVKEPFPDAWRNIMLLFEENRSAKLPLLSGEMQLDLLNPSKRSYVQNTYKGENGSPNNSKSEDLDNVCSEKFVWPILVRTISFLLIRSSFEEFPCTLASALHRLDALLAMDGTNLARALESYQHMDSSRRGPYRAIQFVSIFIFIVHSLTESQKQEDSTAKDDHIHSTFTPSAFAAIFICMGRLTERCMTGNHRDMCPLFPAVLIFVEWLVGAIETIETFGAEENVTNALSYFFGALVDLLDRIEKIGNGTSPDRVALWEDHELKGFHPLLHVHETLEFTTHPECMDDYKSRNESRYHRVMHAATRIMEKSKNSQVWKKGSSFGPKPQPTMEEEEVILFKPITRHNSAPIYISTPTKDSVRPDESQTPTLFADEWLRRATSLSSGQNSEDSDSFSFCSTISNSGHNRSLKQKEPFLKDPTPHPTGPPSLSAWVLSKGSLSIERVNDFSKQKLSPIEEIASTSFPNLSIKDTKEPEAGPIATGHISTIVHDSSPYVTPTPSAPLLPDDASWLRANPVIPSEYKNPLGHEADGILGAAPVSGYTGWASVRPPNGLSGFVEGYHPPLLGMSSSEWLYHYRNSQNVPGNHISPVPFNGNYYSNELSGFDVCDQWGNHLVLNPMLYWGGYGVEEQKRDKFFLGYQRPFPYVCGVGMELGPEEPPLLQYLKERERQLQPGPQLRGPTFMGN